MALAWALVVVAVAAVTFVVVDRAGRGVGQASAARTVAPLPSVNPSVSPSSISSGQPSVGPSSPEPAVIGPSAPAPGPRTASFTTDGGTVVASCAGTTVTLDSITVRDGWRFEQEAEGGGLEVVFESRESEAADVELVLRCVGGLPTRLDR